LRMTSEKHTSPMLFVRRLRVRMLRFVRSFVLVSMVAGISYIILLPLFSKLSASLMVEADLYDAAVKWIPRHLTLDNYVKVWGYMRYPRVFLNSLLLALGASLLQVASCALVGYGLGRFAFRGNGLLFALVMLTLIVPPQVLMTPLYLNFRFFDIFGLLPNPINLINTPYPVLLMSMTGTGLKNGLFIYISRQFFKGMATELEEAAYVDGAGLFMTFYRVMLPCAAPALLVTFLFAFVWQWNDYFYSSLFMSTVELMPNALTAIGSRYVSSLELVRASAGTGIRLEITSQFLSILDSGGMILFVAPLLLMYAFMQRYFMESVERTGLVG